MLKVLEFFPIIVLGTLFNHICNYILFMSVRGLYTAINVLAICHYFYQQKELLTIIVPNCARKQGYKHKQVYLLCFQWEYVEHWDDSYWTRRAMNAFPNKGWKHRLNRKEGHKVACKLKFTSAIWKTPSPLLGVFCLHRQYLRMDGQLINLNLEQMDIRSRHGVNRR